MSRSITAVIISVLTAAAAYPQAFTANLTGIVTDPNQAVIAAANVKLVNTATREARQTTTGASGRYVFSQLLPGSYALTVEMAGFKTTTQNDITLRANQAGEVNVQMTLGQVSESVEVAATVIQLDTQSANQSYTLDRDQILKLPASTRNPFVAVHAMAGVTSMSVGQSNNASDQNQARFAFNGGRDMSGLVLIDGVPATSGDWGALLAAPSVESVQEVVVTRNSYDAEFGKSGGGVVSVVTKGGSNQFHGSVFEFLRNDNLDANAWANNRVGRPRVEFKRNQFGGNLSGPIWKAKKLFFLTSYEALKEGSPATVLATVPTELERAGNFSNTRDANGSVSQVFDPFTTRANPAGGFIRDAFPGNVVPRTRFDSVGAKAVEYYPKPNALPTNAITQANNFFGAGSSITDNQRMDVRIDWARNEKHTMYGRITKAWQTRKTPRFYGTGADTGSEGDQPRHHITWGNTFVPNPKWVINVTAGSGRWREEQLPLSLRDGVLATALGLPQSLVSQLDSPHMPQFSLFGYSGLSNGRVLNFPRQTDNLQVNATRELGKHSVKFGFTGEIVRLNSVDIRSTDFAFDRGMTSGPTAQVSSSTSGNAVASLLLGTGIPTGAAGGVTVVNNTVTNTVVPATSRRYYGAYIQDVWRFNSRMTINLGLRYEVQRASTERFNRYNYFDFSAANPLSQRTGLDLRGGLVFVNDKNRFQTQPDNLDLAPRIGISYKINNRMVARMGYGIFYLMGFGTATQGGPAAGTDGFSVATNWVNTRGGDGITPQDLLSNPYPNGLNKAVGSSLGLLTQTGSATTAFQRSHPTGYVQNYSFDLQFEVGRSGVLEVGYSGNVGRKLNFGATPDANQLPSQFLSLGNALNDQVANPFFGVFPTGILSGRTVPRHRLLRPHPQFVSVNLSGDTPGASSNFNALYIKFNKRFRGGLNIMSSYQFSKAIDNASENQGWIVSDTFRDYGNRSLDRSVSGHDVPQSFATALVWEVPVGKGRLLGATMHRALDTVVGGWEVSSVIRFTSGTPLRLVAPNTLSAYGFGIVNAQVGNLLDVGVSERRPEQWFNTTAVRAPAPFTLGNAPRFAPNLRADGTHHADINIAKNFQIMEKIRAQFRGELYNLTNTPQFGVPGLTVGAADFGQVNGTRFNDRRTVQLGLKILF
ncbi:MAG: carboxypeptidase-like regulatory domain-containing protein [Acidobacteria bacterium]|nr:carboxypeptidase-like regulatory domain-containing protein [Acidobacteriota bacterium]